MYVHKRQSPKELKEVSVIRCVGFRDAVDRLGYHTLAGRAVRWSCDQVRKVLKGHNISARLLKRIVERAPELLTLRYVADGVKAQAKEMGWKEAAA